ncbi:MAG: molecular chaperone [Proteus mirabilis]|nr:molecular chaperone [Proteus mirabilis]HEK0656267.1 molecular chaperone [Proteus mirabilis]HEK2071975.1 molecular chaperone [Proteus mirabilis]
MKKHIRKYKNIIFILFFFIPLVFANDNKTNISFEKSRAIFETDKQNKFFFKMINSGEKPVLMQAWIRNNESSDDIEKDVNKNFIVVPPLVKVEPENENLFEIIKANNHFAKDREEISYLRIKIIPLQEKESNQITLTPIFNFKIYHRPENIPAIEDSQFYKNVKFHLDDDHLYIENSSPYFISFSYIKIDGIDISNEELMKMTNPFSQGEYKVTGKAKNKNISWVFIDSLGFNSEEIFSSLD